MYQTTYIKNADKIEKSKRTRIMKLEEITNSIRHEDETRKQKQSVIYKKNMQKAEGWVKEVEEGLKKKDARDKNYGTQVRKANDRGVV